MNLDCAQNARFNPTCTHITRTYVCEYKLKHKSYVQSNAFAHESAKIRPHHCPTPCLSKSGQFGNCIITQRKAAGIIACLRLKIQALKHIIRNLNPLNMMFFLKDVVGINAMTKATTKQTTWTSCIHTF